MLKDFEQLLEQKQRNARNNIIALAEQAGPDVSFFIDDERVTKTQYIRTLRETAEGYKLPFAYSKHTQSFYLLTKEYLAEVNK